jgi:hypothetical protein
MARELMQLTLFGSVVNRYPCLVPAQRAAFSQFFYRQKTA